MKAYEMDFDRVIENMNCHLSEVERILASTTNRKMSLSEIEEGFKHLVSGYKPYLAMILSVGITDISKDAISINIKSSFALFKKLIFNRILEIREEGRELFDTQPLLGGNEWEKIKNYFNDLNEKERTVDEQGIDEMGNEIDRTMEIMKIFDKLQMVNENEI